MDRKKPYGKPYGRHASFRPQRDSRSPGLLIMKLLLAPVVVFLLIQGYEGMRRRDPPRESPPGDWPRQVAPPVAPVAMPSEHEPVAPPREERVAITVASPVMAGPSGTALPAAEESSPPAEPEAGEGTEKFVMEMNRYNSFMGQGAINGKDVLLLADTGAYHVVVPEKLAQRIGLKKGAAMTFGTAGGSVIHYATMLDSLALGKIEIRNVAAVINPAMREDFVLLGMSALGLMDMQLEQGKLVLSYRPPKASKSSGEPVPADEPFKRTIKECVRPGNKFDKDTLACLRGQ